MAKLLHVILAVVAVEFGWYGFATVLILIYLEMMESF